MVALLPGRLVVPQRPLLASRRHRPTQPPGRALGLAPLPAMGVCCLGPCCPAARQVSRSSDSMMLQTHEQGPRVLASPSPSPPRLCALPPPWLASHLGLPKPPHPLLRLRCDARGEGRKPPAAVALGRVPPPARSRLTWHTSGHTEARSGPSPPPVECERSSCGSQGPEDRASARPLHGKRPSSPLATD